LGKDDGELLAAVARDQVVLPEGRLAQTLGDRTQCLVTGDVPVVVVSTS